MIRVVCPSCGSKLTAKDKHAGHTKPCPKCGQPIYIMVPEGVEVLPSIPVEEPDSSQFGLLGNNSVCNRMSWNGSASVIAIGSAIPRMSLPLGPATVKAGCLKRMPAWSVPPAIAKKCPAREISCLSN